MKTLGLIGAGHIGSQLARLAVKNGYDVVVSNSRGPETLADLIRELGPHAHAATPEEAAKAGDIVVVTIPLKNLPDVPAAPLTGKIVIDTLNYYPQRDGHIADLDNEKTTTSEMVQAHLRASQVVKAFNHIYAAELTARPAGRVARPPRAGDCRQRRAGQEGRRCASRPVRIRHRRSGAARRELADSARHAGLRPASYGGGAAQGSGGSQATAEVTFRLATTL